MTTSKSFFIGIVFLIAARVCLAIGDNSENSIRMGEPAEADIEKQCGITFREPGRIDVRLVAAPSLDPLARCVLLLIRRGRPPVQAERGLGEGYREIADFVLVVRSQPITENLIEFDFAPSIEPGQSVRYVGKPLTETARSMGYSEEKAISFSAYNKGGGELYVGKSTMTRKRGTSSVRLKRMNILWGNEDLSVGA